MTYKIGIMMIGSLYWDKSDIRVNWRNNRLYGEEFCVLAPIRYGRRSKKRGNTYTMVFSRLCLRKNYGLGSAKVVTCKNKIDNIEEIIEEAKHLWVAECDQKEAKNKFWANWGSVGLLRNPKTLFLKNYFSSWSALIANSDDYVNINHSKSEKPALDASGFLNIPWPTLKNQGDPLPVDLIIATAANPTLSNGSYPKAEVIAEVWKNDKHDNEKYFWNNLKHGIHTFQDSNIEKFLK